MKINDIYESTTAGSVATVAQPMTGNPLKRSNVGQGVYPNQKAGSLLTGKKSVSEEWTHEYSPGNTSHWSGTVNTGKYIHDGNVVAIYTGFEHPSTGRQSHIKVKFLPTGKVKQFSNTRSGFNEAEKWIRSDWRLQGSATDRTGNMFESAKTKKSKNEFDAELDSKGRFTKASVRKMFNGKLSPDAKGIKEAHLDEDELIIMPGQGHRLKSGFIPHDHDRRDHEVEMARSDLFQAAKNAKQTFEMLQGVSEDQGLEGWVQAKITKAADYLNSVRQYLEGKHVREMTGGVIAGGGVGEARSQKYEMRFTNGKTQRFVAATPEEAKKKAKGLGATSLIKVSTDGMPQGKVAEGKKVQEAASDPIEKRITVKKWGGNDDHSWAVLVDGKPAVTGLSKREVPHYKSQVMKKLQEKPQLTGTNLEEGKQETYNLRDLGNDLNNYVGSDSESVLVTKILNILRNNYTDSRGASLPNREISGSELMSLYGISARQQGAFINFIDKVYGGPKKDEEDSYNSFRFDEEADLLDEGMDVKKLAAIAAAFGFNLVPNNVGDGTSGRSPADRAYDTYLSQTPSHLVPRYTTPIKGK